jgi:hypothetical protein
MSILEKFIAEVLKSQQEISVSAMIYPQTEPFHHGIQVGRYQGMQMAHDILIALIRERDEQEKFS